MSDAAGASPRFAFGFGESYTTFSLSNLRAPSFEDLDDTTIRVTVDVTNTGDVTGAEVVQVYGGAATSAWSRPVRRLLGFTRVDVAPGDTKAVEVLLDVDMLRVWDADAGALVLEPTAYTLEVGTASNDLPLQTTWVVD